MHVFDLQELEAATDHFSPSRLIGKGSHGSVYRGLLNDGRLVVAVKKQSLAFQNLRDNTKIENEASILSNLSSSCHLIIDLLGVGHDAHGNKLIVTRHMPNGTLHDALHVSPTPPTWRKRVEIALQVARGVRFLHESTPTIVHRDIKPANILFDTTWSATLADFGLAVRLINNSGGSDDDTRVVLPAGTIGYIDPSYTTPGKVSTGIDVFSYGVVLLELVSGRKAMDVSKSPPSIVEWALPLIGRGRWVEVCDERVRLTREVKRVLRVAARCLEARESDRPTMGEVVAVLEKLTVGPVKMSTRFSSFRDVVVNLMGFRKFRFGGMGTKSGTCGDRCADNSSGNRMSKGTLLVREILADITLK